MNEEGKNVIPIRQTSSRRSKPSMDLLIDSQRTLSSRKSKPSIDRLVDNQRVFSPFVIPKKNSSTDILKLNLSQKHPENKSDLISVDETIKLRRESLRSKDITINTENHSDSMSVDEAVKLRRVSLRFQDNATNLDIKSPKMIKNQSVMPVFSTKRRTIQSSKNLNNKRKISSPVINGLNSTDSSEIEKNIISNLQYVTLKLNKIDIPRNVITETKNSDNCEEDDIPLSKIFPDFKSPDMKEVSVKCEDIGLVSHTKKVKVKKQLEIAVVSNGTQSPKSPLSNSDCHSVKNGTVKRVHKEGRRTRSKDGPVKVECKETHLTTVAPNVVVEPEPVVVERQPPCARDKCTNVAVDDFRWDNEFCSADCAMIYSKSMFIGWLAERRTRLQMRI